MRTPSSGEACRRWSSTPRGRTLLDRFPAVAGRAIAEENDPDEVTRRCRDGFGAAETPTLPAAAAPDAAVRRAAARALGEVRRVQERWPPEAMVETLRAAGIDLDAFDSEDPEALARAVAGLDGA